ENTPKQAGFFQCLCSDGQQIKDGEEDEAFKAGFVKLAGVARLVVRHREDDAPWEGCWAAEEFTIHEIGAAAEEEADGTNDGDEVSEMKRIQFVALREEKDGGDDADEAAVERHTAFPDFEHAERVGEIFVKVIEKDVTDATAEDHAEDGPGDEVVDHC